MIICLDICFGKQKKTEPEKRVVCMCELIHSVHSAFQHGATAEGVASNMSASALGGKGQRRQRTTILEGRLMNISNTGGNGHLG